MFSSVALASLLCAAWQTPPQPLPSAPSAQRPAPQAPLAQGLDREAFTFTRYDLKVTITPDQQALAVEGSITLRNDTDKAQPHATLQISSSLDWQEITISGRPAEYTTHEYIS